MHNESMNTWNWMQLTDAVKLTLGPGDFAVQNKELIFKQTVIFAAAEWKISMDNAEQDENASQSGATADMSEMKLNDSSAPNTGILSYIQYAYSHLYSISYTYRFTKI